MNGKDKCEVLKQIRRDIVEANGLDVEITDCSHVGDCSGTCPKCEAETSRIEAELGKKRALGMKIAVAGLSAAVVASSFAGCTQFGKTQLEGDVPYTEDLGGAIAETEPTDEYMLEGEIAIDETCEDETDEAEAPETEAGNGSEDSPEGDSAES